jgi:hypothetical protein
MVPALSLQKLPPRKGHCCPPPRQPTIRSCSQRLVPRPDIWDKVCDSRFLCQPEIIPGIKYFELPKSRPVVTPSKKEIPNECGTAHWGFTAPSDVLLSLTIRSKQFLVLFSFRVGFCRSADDKGRKCLASEHYRMMLTAPCSLSASMSRTAFLWWIFNCPSTCFSLCSYQPT